MSGGEGRAGSTAGGVVGTVVALAFFFGLYVYIKRRAGYMVLQDNNNNEKEGSDEGFDSKEDNKGDIVSSSKRRRVHTNDAMEAGKLNNTPIRNSYQYPERSKGVEMTNLPPNICLEPGPMKLVDCPPPLPPSVSYPLRQVAFNANYTVLTPATGSDLSTEAIIVHGPKTSCTTVWTNSLATMEQVLSKCQTELQRLERIPVNPALHGDSTSLSKLQADFQNAEAAERAAQDRLANLTAKFGESHVNRDALPTQGAPTSTFPTGQGFIAQYKAWGVRFSLLASDVCAALVASGQTPQAAAETFVLHIASPIHEGTLRYVERAIAMKQERLVDLFGPSAAARARDQDDVAWHFFLYTHQSKLLAEMLALPQAAIDDLMREMDPMVVKAQQLGACRGWTASNTDVRVLVKQSLVTHMIALLSDPRCYLHPSPGARVKFQSGRCEEVLRSQVLGPLRESAEVEVVLSGLHFNDPDRGDVPIVPALVIRM
jgi:hypothetical protein